MKSVQMNNAAMYSATFIFEKRQFDDEFHRLDASIAEAARRSSGYVGEDAWENPSNGLISNVYYWSSMDGLNELMRHPDHLKAKAAQSTWLKGYQVVISQVMRAYGDGSIEHPTAGLKT